MQNINILTQLFYDYISLRRYLIMYGFMEDTQEVQILVYRIKEELCNHFHVQITVKNMAQAEPFL